MAREASQAGDSTGASPDAARFACQLAGIGVSFGEVDVLEDIDLVIGPTDRVAVVGDNGSGKSTLLRLLAGTVAPDAGQRTVNVPGFIAYAQQDPQFSAGEIIQQVIDSYHHRFRELERLMTAINERLKQADEAATGRLLGQLEQVTDLYEAADGYSLAPRLDGALQQLGLGELPRDMMAASLSGGQRSRLALACVLCSGAQLLLLDEPTNDLDEAAMQWLEGMLQAHRGALVVVSHDRVFLERFASSIVVLRDRGITRYGTGYRGYLRARAAERAAVLAAHESWSAELARARKLVQASAARVEAVARKRELPGFGHGNFRARSRTHGSTSRIRQAKSRIEELESMPAPRPAPELAFTMPGTLPAGLAPELLVHLEYVERREPPRLRTGDLRIHRGQRWLVTGANGAGKSTLLKVLAGELQIQGGTRHSLPGLRIGWLRQELGTLPGTSLIEAFALATETHLEEAIEILVGLGLFEPRDFVRPVRGLSAGQRRRLELAVAVSREADLLLLDEPTNHLSPELVEQLEAALLDYPGAVVTVTHDARWQQKLAERAVVHRLGVEAGNVRVVK